MVDGLWSNYALWPTGLGVHAGPVSHALAAHRASQVSSAQFTLELDRMHSPRLRSHALAFDDIIHMGYDLIYIYIYTHHTVEGAS